MRKQIFRSIDSMLPRGLALLPYQFALLLLKLIFEFGLGVLVWNRNSTKNGTAIFGVSDLDITIIHNGNISLEFLQRTLVLLKKIIPFLGEANIYQTSHLPFLLPMMNTFELKRDPDLYVKFNGTKNPTNAEKFVFIQRMLFSDAFSLKMEPELRQLKWKNHFKLIRFDFDKDFVDFDDVINVLVNLSNNNSKIKDSLNRWSLNFSEKNFDVYRADLGDGFGVMAPHYKLWFSSPNDVVVLSQLEGIEREIFLSQIDWEICGVYAQKFHLPKDQVRFHLEMLLKAKEVALSSHGEKAEFPYLEILF